MGFLCSVMSSAKTESFTSSFPFECLLCLFSCLIPKARTPSIMLNNSGESGHSCLVPDLRGKYLSVFPLRMVFVVGFS